MRDALRKPRETAVPVGQANRRRVAEGAVYREPFSIEIPYAVEQGIRTRELRMHLLVQGIAHWFGHRVKSRAQNCREWTLRVWVRSHTGYGVCPDRICSHNVHGCGKPP